jgi:hypothetical protein
MKVVLMIKARINRVMRRSIPHMLADPRVQCKTVQRRAQREQHLHQLDAASSHTSASDIIRIRATYVPT